MTLNWRTAAKLVNITIHRNNDMLKLEKVALDSSVECCAPPPGWRDLEL